MYIDYKGFFGSAYSDYLPLGQVDSFSVDLVAGVTYELRVVSASTLLDIALGTTTQIVRSMDFAGTGTILTYTPPSSGHYGIGIDTATGVSGSYTIAAGVIGTPAQGQASVSAPVQITRTDTTTGVTTTPAMAIYTGPVSGLTHEFIDVSTDNLNITATSPDVFIHSGSGMDALQVLSGNNVVDGGTGSNFLVGGAGSDTFFVDDRSAPADIWSTLVNFHAGDVATVWGVSPSGFSFVTSDGKGAVGYTGLTVTASAPGKPNASLTIAGYTQADLTNGRLSVIYGYDQVSKSDFAYFHGN